jgi:hypothetical protein
MRLEEMGWSNLVQDGVHWRNLVNTVMNSGLPYGIDILNCQSDYFVVENNKSNWASLCESVPICAVNIFSNETLALSTCTADTNLLLQKLTIMHLPYSMAIDYNISHLVKYSLYLKLTLYTLK